MKHFLLLTVLASLGVLLWRTAPHAQKKQVVKALKKYAAPIFFVLATIFTAMAVAIHLQAVKLF